MRAISPKRLQRLDTGYTKIWACKKLKRGEIRAAEAEKFAERYIQIKSDWVLLKIELSCILAPILCTLVVYI